MAISANSVWEIRTSATASNANGGFFVTGASGTDFSQQDASQYSLTGLTTAAADAIILSASAAADMVGNCIKINSGTNFTVGRYEIISVVVGVSITVDRNVTTAAGTAGAGVIGGALSLGSSDDAIFELAIAGNIFHVKTGTYTLGGIVTIAASGSITAPIKIIGYNAAREDNPTGSTRPIFDSAGNGFAITGSSWNISNIQTKSSASGGAFQLVGSNINLSYCKATNISTTAGRIAISFANNSYVYRSEAISYRGIGIQTPNNTTQVGRQIIGCYIHDSDVGINTGLTSNTLHIENNIIASCVTNAFVTTNALTGQSSIRDNTFYGAENKQGTGINIITGGRSLLVLNNIIYGFVTGLSHADATHGSFEDFNALNNNTTNRTNFPTGPNSITTAPGFVGVTQVTGATATTSGSVLTQLGATFVTNGVTAGRDYLYIKSGTGITAGIYGISSLTETTLTLDIAPGTSAVADKVFQITVGQNFAIGTNLKGIGLSGVFPGGLSTGYMDIGAVQRQEAGSGGGGSFTFAL